MMEESETEAWVSLSKAAKIIGVSYPTICRMRDKKQITCILLGGVYRVYQSELERLRREGNLAPAPPPTEEPGGA